jgi:tetratricopeptide (TPR) repeat protein
MSLKAVVTVIAVLFANASMSADAHSSWSFENRAGNLAFHQKNYSEASKCFKRALRLARKEAKSAEPKQTISLAALELTACAQRKIKEETRQASLSSSLLENFIDSSDADFADCLLELGKMYQQQRKFEDAIKIFKIVLNLHEKSHSSSDTTYSAALNSLGLTYLQQGNVTASESSLKKALESTQSFSSSEVAGQCAILNNLGLLCSASLRYEEAESAFKKSITLSETSDCEPFAKSEPLANLAELYGKFLKYEQAESLLRRAVAYMENQKPAHAAHLSGFLVSLGYYCSKLGNYIEAEELYKRALKIDKTTIGSNNLKIARDLNALAVLYFVQKNYSKAVPLHKTVLKIMESEFGPKDSELYKYLLNYAEALQQVNRVREADVLTNRAGALLMDPAIADCEKDMSPDDQRWNELLPDYIELLKKAHRFGDAKAAESKLLKVKSK